MNIRTGLGQDSHRFLQEEKKKPLILAGIEISGAMGFEANSDGDVIFHALFNALSSAIGEQSLGIYADPMLKKGITDSRKYLDVIMNKVLADDWEINNISISIEAKEPRLEKYEPAMKDNIGKALHIYADQIGIAFTSGEGLTAFGRGEGMQALVFVCLIKSKWRKSKFSHPQK